MLPLAGKVAIVTGAAGGIGSATARLLAERGAKVAIADINAEGARRVAAEIATNGGTAVAIPVDLAQEDQIQEMVPLTLDAFGRIDILHNNAADLSPDFYMRDRDAESMDVEVWDRTFRVNVRGSMLCCKHTLPHMPHIRFDAPPVDSRVRIVKANVADRITLPRVFDAPFDIIFHLACIAGGLAEQNFELGKQVNLDGTIRRLDLAREQAKHPVLIYSSSIGVYGQLPSNVTDDTPAKPTWSYGTHKLIGELLMADYSRKGWVDARTQRFPGIVARPPDPSGALSAFLSDLIRSLSEGKGFVCPVSPEANSWWMSVQCCIDNMVHAALLPASGLSLERVWPLPPLRASIAEVVDAVGPVYGVPARELVSYAPQPEIEERFGRLPEARFRASEALGFHHDGSVDAMVRGALV
jgi:nucleoside-diphosphate-sugar epimerase